MQAATYTSASRQLLQSTVTAEDLTNALSKIDLYSKVGGSSLG